MRDRRHVLAAGLALAAAVEIQLIEERRAEACGCLSPPAPVSNEEYAVNQRAEQIIFEAEPGGFVTAHVLIKYSGAPEKFAWLLPVPEVPELGISPTSAFGILDSITAPDVGVDVQDICPVSAWQCHFHAHLSCGWGGAASGDDDSGAFADAPAGPSGGSVNPVTVLGEQVVGDFQTVTFRATEATAATQWLRDNGFIVNPTTSIYMESYVQQNMVFVAAKLVAGAGVSAIKPLKLRYRAPFPMIPLVLTAVAAEPNLTVTAFVYGNGPFRPQGHPVVAIDKSRIAQDHNGRTNYPMVLARAVDEAGGDGFAIEYSDIAPRPQFGGGTPCCSNDFDLCNVGNNGTCECPNAAFDQTDCGKIGDLVDGAKVVDDLANKYAFLTRLTTRVSPEEMTFDPQFELDPSQQTRGRLQARGTQVSLKSCTGAIVDKDREDFLAADARQDCASLYCGPMGQCVTTATGAACACSAGTVAQRFTDLDGIASVTCVPKTPTVDLRAGGQVLPDACANLSCGMGQCIDRNGTAVCDCDGAAAAVAGTGRAPRCEAIEQLTHTTGAQNYSDDLRRISVCAPAPPSCGEGGWLVKGTSPRPGVDCGGTEPAAALTEEPPAPSCGFFGCGGCQQSNETPPVAGFVMGGAVLGLLVAGKRRRRNVS